MKSGIFAWSGVEDNSLWTVDKYNLLFMFLKSVILKKEQKESEVKGYKEQVKCTLELLLCLMGCIIV